MNLAATYYVRELRSSQVSLKMGSAGGTPGRFKDVMFTDVDGRDVPGRGGGNSALPLGLGDSISLPRPPAQRMKHGRET